RLARRSALEAARSRGMRAMHARMDEVSRMGSLSREDLVRLEEQGERKARTWRHPRSGPLLRLVLGLPQSRFDELFRAGEVRVDLGSLPEELQSLAVSAAGVPPDGAEAVRQGTLRLGLAGRVE